MFKQFKADFTPSLKVDGTYSMSGAPVKFDTGYQVSFERPNDTYSDDLYDTTVIRLCALLGSMVYIGVWEGTKELSFHTESLADALHVAKVYHQDAIYCWHDNKVITTK